MALIVEQGNHYCIGLKGNQPKLLAAAQRCAQTQRPHSADYQVLDISHGRCVERRIEVFAAPAKGLEAWQGVAAFVNVERCGMRDGRTFIRQSWYILSELISAQRAAALIQGHRGTIENRLHWVKDVVQQEDDSLIQAPKPAYLLAILRSWALSAFRQAGHASITRAIRLFGHDLTKLISFL